MRNTNTSYPTVPFNKPHVTGNEFAYIRNAHALGRLAGDGYYTKKTQEWLENTFDCKRSLLTHSATAALEMMAILANIEPGDEVIMPDYTFVSTANAFVLRGGVPVFVDIRPDTLNINEALIESAITAKTKAIMVVHYAGVGCEMDQIRLIAKRHKLILLEDAAQAILAKYKQQYLGTIGEMSALSFHETKNIISGEGGALLVNDPKYSERAVTVRDAGTNRSKFFLGQVHEYSWVDIGSSYVPGEITASFLMAQLEHAAEITKKRISLWKLYHKELSDLERRGFVRRPTIPSTVTFNAHLYYILTRSRAERIGLMAFLNKRRIEVVTHYVPLHSSYGGRKFSRHIGELPVSNRTANTLLRLPLFYDLTLKQQGMVLQAIHDYYKRI